MPLPMSVSPEEVYSDVLNRAQAYAALSVSLAGEGDIYGACLALIAADMCRVQALLWQRALVVSTNPDGQYAAVLTAIDTGLKAWAGSEAVPFEDCRASIVAMRASLRAAFDESVWTMLEPRLDSIEHLAGLPLPSSDDVQERRSALLGTSVMASAGISRDAKARDHVSVAVAMAQNGRSEDAVNEVYHADLSTFEAHIIDSALAAGDDYLSSAEAVWLLGCDAVKRIPSLSPDLTLASQTIRKTLSAVVGVVDSDRLRGRFIEINDVETSTHISEAANL